MLNAKHMMFIIAGLGIVSMKTYPAVFTRLVGRDAWLAVAVASMCMVLYIYFLVWVCKKRQCYSLARIYRSALGTTIGNAMLGAFMVSILLNLIECASVEASAMHEHFLLDIPPWQFMIVLVGVGFYIASRGYQSVVTTTLIHITGIATTGLGLFILVAKYKNYDYLFPIMANGLTADFFWAVIKLMGIMSAIVIILPFFARVSDKENLLKFTTLGTLFVAQNLVVTMIGVITTFSIPWLNSLYYAKLCQTQLVSHFDFMEAGELFVIYQLVGGWLMKYILCFFATMTLTRVLTKTKAYYFWGISAVVFCFGSYLNRSVFLLFDAIDYFAYASFVGLIILPLMIFTLFLFKNSNVVAPKNTSVSS